MSTSYIAYPSSSHSHGSRHHRHSNYHTQSSPSRSQYYVASPSYHHSSHRHGYSSSDNGHGYEYPQYDSRQRRHHSADYAYGGYGGTDGYYRPSRSYSRDPGYSSSTGRHRGQEYHAAGDTGQYNTAAYHGNNDYTRGRRRSFGDKLRRLFGLGYSTHSHGIHSRSKARYVDAATGADVDVRGKQIYTV